MKFLVTFILFFCLISEGYSQKSLNDYSFVVVPEKFDFVSETDKYQLNSLTKFLFNKHGFNAYFNRELPDVRRCDGLWAEVEGKPAIIRTKVTVILNDCNGVEVYRSEVGKSKLKAYSKTYTAALRDAFLSIEALGVQQKDPKLFSDSDAVMEEEQSTKVVVDDTPNESTEVISTEAVSSTSVVEKEVVKNISEETLYVNNGGNFGLRNTKSGYTLYEKLPSGDTLKGTLLIKDGKTLQFMDVTGNKFPGYFDADENLIIETSFQKLIFTKQR